MYLSAKIPIAQSFVDVQLILHRLKQDLSTEILVGTDVLHPHCVYVKANLQMHLAELMRNSESREDKYRNASGPLTATIPHVNRFLKHLCLLLVPGVAN